MMDDKELGLSIFTQLGGKGRSITIRVRTRQGGRPGCSWMKRHSSSNTRLCVVVQPASAAAIRQTSLGVHGRSTNDHREADHLRLTDT